MLTLLFLHLLPLLLVTGGLAVPYNRAASKVPASALSLPAGQNQLVAPTSAPSSVTLAVGINNLSCTDEGNLVTSGLSSQLYDITGLFPAPEFSNIQLDAYNNWTAAQTLDPSDPSFVQQLESTFGISLTGQYNIGQDDVGGLITTVEIANNVLVAKVTGDIPAPGPDSDTNLDWQEMTAVSESLTTQIFRVSTRGGESQDGSSLSCDPSAPSFTFKFAAQIWKY